MLEKEKEELQSKMNSGNIDYEDLKKASARIEEIIHRLDILESRWLVLSEKM